MPARRTVTLDRLGGFVRARTRGQQDAAIKAIRLSLATDGLRLVQEAISSAQPPPVDRGTYRRSWKTADVPRGGRLFNPAVHAAVIEDGRRRGARMPPPAIIGEWARRKGLLKGVPKSERKNAQRAIGFVIARAIAKRGIKGRLILASVMPAIKKAVRDAVRHAIREAP